MNFVDSVNRKQEGDSKGRLQTEALYQRVNKVCALVAAFVIQGRRWEHILPQTEYNGPFIYQSSAGIHKVRNTSCVPLHASVFTHTHAHTLTGALIDIRDSYIKECYWINEYNQRKTINSEMKWSWFHSGNLLVVTLIIIIAPTNIRLKIYCA